MSTRTGDRYAGQNGSFRGIDDDVVAAIAQAASQVREKNMIAVRLSFGERCDPGRHDADVQRPLHSSKNS